VSESAPEEIRSTQYYRSC